MKVQSIPFQFIWKWALMPKIRTPPPLMLDNIPERYNLTRACKTRFCLSAKLSPSSCLIHCVLLHDCLGTYWYTVRPCLLVLPWTFYSSRGLMLLITHLLCSWSFAPPCFSLATQPQPQLLQFLIFSQSPRDEDFATHMLQ